MAYSRSLLSLLLATTFTTAFASGQAKPAKPPATLRSILLEQLRSTHNKAEWFVPVNTAVEGLTPEQARWTPPLAPGSKIAEHSVGQLANHLLFWNAQELAKFKGEKPAAFNGNNDETFNSFDAATWTGTVHRLDQVLTEIEHVVETADEAHLQSWASELAHIGTHNAYHTGQILYLRKLQGTWNPEKGVK